MRGGGTEESLTGQISRLSIMLSSLIERASCLSVSHVAFKDCSFFELPSRLGWDFQRCKLPLNHPCFYKRPLAHAPVSKSDKLFD